MKTEFPIKNFPPGISIISASLLLDRTYFLDLISNLTYGGSWSIAIVSAPWLDGSWLVSVDPPQPAVCKMTQITTWTWKKTSFRNSILVIFENPCFYTKYNCVVSSIISNHIKLVTAKVNSKQTQLHRKKGRSYPSPITFAVTVFFSLLLQLVLQPSAQSVLWMVNKKRNPYQYCDSK